MNKRIGTIISNGVMIPTECICFYCGSTMERGFVSMGSGVNEVTYWCPKCGALSIHAKDSSNRKINEFSITYGFDDKQED